MSTVPAQLDPSRRVLTRHAALSAALRTAIPRRERDKLLLATWNLREFDTPGYGVRSDECLLYIAEIVSRFELVALQEIREDLSAFARLMALLGPHWKFLVTDVTEGDAGNNERLAYVYDSRKVEFGGLAGEVVLPGARRQFARTPYTCGFHALGTTLQLCTVHVFYGTSRAVDPRRLAEIRGVADALAERAAEKHSWSPNLCLLGDFNIFRRTDVTYRAIVDAGFEVPAALQSIPGSNVPKNKLYDQMALLPGGTLQCTGKAGVLDFFESVYRTQDERSYARAMGESYARSKNPAQYYRSRWRTFQMSDHLPMWMQLGAI